MVGASATRAQRVPKPGIVTDPADAAFSAIGITLFCPPLRGVAIAYARHAKPSVPSNAIVNVPDAVALKSTKFEPSPHGARFDALFVLGPTLTLTGYVL